MRLCMETLAVLNHYEDIGEENEKNTQEVNEDFILIKDNLDILKKLKEKICDKITLNGRISFN